MPSPVLLLGIGGAAGFLAGFLGAGGGFATVVLLIAAGVPVHETIGTSLVFTVLIGLWGTILHLRQGTASPALALSLGIPSAITALAGAQLAEAFSERTLTFLFGLLTAFVVVMMLRPQQDRVKADVGAERLAHADDAIVPEIENERENGRPFVPHGRPLAVAVAGGAMIGLMKGLFGVGGGFLLMPFMLLVLGISENLAVGSSLFAILIGSIVGGLRHATLGNVGGDLLLVLVPAGLIGSFAGARVSKTASPHTIRAVFVAILVAATAYLLIKSL